MEKRVLYDWLPKKENKPQGILWVKKVVGIIAIFCWNRFAFVSY